MELGTSNYGKQTFKKKNHFKFDKDTNVIIARILPPMGALASKGIWSRFHVGIFGYKNMEGQHRVFASTLVEKATWVDGKKTVEIISRDPALERLRDLKDKLEKAKTEGNTALYAKLNGLVGFKGVYSENRFHHMNVVLLDGSIGELAIKHKCKKSLDDEIDKLRAQGVDPTSVDNGRFFVFTRSGIGNDTIFKVDVYKEKVDVQGMGKMEREMVHALTPELISRFETEAFNLDDIYTKITAEECEQIVNESNILSGRSPACNRIFDDRWKAKRDSQQGASNQASTSVTAPVAPTTQPTQAATATVSTPALNVLTAAEVQKPSPVQPQATVVTSPQASVEEMSDEEFFKSMNVEISR